MAMYEKFSQFPIGGSLTSSDILVGLRGGVNTQFNAPNNIVKTWNHLTAPVDVNAGRNVTITNGIIGTSADPNVVSLWDGSTSPVAVTAGNYITITDGVISVTETVQNVVTSWNGSTNPVDVTAGSNINITNGVISTPGQPNVVTSWNGSTTPVAITAGFNVDITGGVISATGALENVVTKWNGSISPVEVTAGTNMSITSGVISTSAQPNVITSWDGSTSPLAITAGDNITITGGVISAAPSDPPVVTSWNGSSTPVAVTAGEGMSLIGGAITSNAAVRKFGSLVYLGGDTGIETSFSTAGVPVPLAVGGTSQAISLGSFEADFTTGVINYLGGVPIIAKFTISLSYKVYSGSQPYVIYIYQYISGGTGWVPLRDYQKVVTPYQIPLNPQVLTFDVGLTGPVQLNPYDRLGVWVSNSSNTFSFFMTNLTFMTEFSVNF